MAYKDLLVVLDTNPHVRERILLAAELADRFDAHLTGLYVALSPEPGAPRHAQRVRALFEDLAGRRSRPTEWRSTSGFPIDIAAVHARYADLIILGQLDPDDAQAFANNPPPEDVVLAAGRPILVVPYAGTFEPVGRNVLVCWDASREATRAVNDAMPLLAGAASVTILTVDAVQSPEQHGDVPGADIALYLARHGVKAQVERTVSDGIGVGNTLLSRASDIGADLLVMGAYSHSRVRELVMGGTTRTVLQTMTLPVLMAH